MSDRSTEPVAHAGQAIVAAHQPMAELAVERVLDKRYKILQPIGVGGSSQVYLAQDTVLNRQVAIKVLDAAAAGDPALRKMFVKEARALAALSHPSIVAVYDVGEVDGLPFIVMEHLPGGSLKQRIERSGPLTPVEAVTQTVDIANGLAFAHSKGIIHADLKPSNILYDANDHAKIADFGIARTPQESADTPQLFATAMYVAPERVEGKPATPATDIYGIGLVLYEMLVGKPPFVSANAAVLLRDHVVRMPVPPSHLRPTLVRELDTIVLRALAKEPRLRYQKASDVAQALVSIENLDKDLATTRFATVMTEPIQEFMPEVAQSPVVALLSSYGQPIRNLFFGIFIALPVVALGSLADFGLVPTGIAAGTIVLAALAAQLGPAVGLAWAMETFLLLLFVPGLAVLYAILGIWIWARDVPPERTALAMAMPVLAPFGLAPALVLTAAAIEGLMGAVTVAWGAFITVVAAMAIGRQSFGPFVETGFVLQQPSLFDPVRAAQTKAALINLLVATSDRFSPLGVLLDPATLWSQLAGLVSRVVGSDVAAIATILAWTITALAVWTVTRMLRSFFDTLLRRPGRWFALYVFAQAVGVTVGTSLMFMLFVTWGPLAKAAGRPAESVLLLAAFVGAVLATAASVVINATQRPAPPEEHSASVTGRRR
ncbi:MAG TPA: serine/threonine-protein kinase [Candidatus Limnocylindrales bacterium]|nr:serine/threonine-protein kinase [Candidatus Limnocylindrales bacterium]